MIGVNDEEGSIDCSRDSLDTRFRLSSVYRWGVNMLSRDRLAVIVDDGGMRSSKKENNRVRSSSGILEVYYILPRPSERLSHSRQ